VFDATFNNISVISWRSVLLVEKTTDLPQDTDKRHHIMLYRVHLLARKMSSSLHIICIKFSGITNKFHKGVKCEKKKKNGQLYSLNTLSGN
jgi:hypothetical protein